MIKSYLGPFVLTFFISLFVLVMQFLWKYIDDLAGKGLEWNIILELMLYASATLVPMALPLAILLSSIMTMGSTAENLELVATKASGISLLKLMRPLIILAAATSILAFLFANYAMPVANFKLRNLLAAIQRTRPAIDIQPNVYYDGIKGLVVKVEEKGKDERTFYNIMVYDHSKDTYGATSVTLARRGQITISEDNRYLSFKLWDGIRYDERGYFTRQDDKFPFYREIFSEQEILIDLSEFKFNRENSAFLKNQFSMMNVWQLNKVRAEMMEDLDKTYVAADNSLLYHYKAYSDGAPRLQNTDPGTMPIPNSDLIPGFNPEQVGHDETEVKKPDSLPPPPKRVEKVSLAQGEFLNSFTPQDRKVIVDQALLDLGNIRSDLKSNMTTLKSKRGQIVRNEIEWHRKYSLSIACFILFFIGAPLGAIIRKGGLGWPMIFCILIFIIYYVISTIGEKAVRQLAMSPLEGMWISSLVLFPFGVFLTLKASTDSPLFVAETYLNLFRRLRGRR